MTKIGAAGLSQVNQAIGKNQRMKLHSPTAGTVVGIGHRAPNACYSGFGASTKGHVFLHAGGDEKSSWAVMQSEGNLVAQRWHHARAVQAIRNCAP